MLTVAAHSARDRSVPRHLDNLAGMMSAQVRRMSALCIRKLPSLRRGWLLLGPLGLGLVGCGDERAGGAASRPTASVGIVVIGDFGVGRHRQRALGSAVRAFARRHRVDLVVTVGDNNYAGTSASFHTNWKESFGWLRSSRIPVAGALGNHDVEVGGGRYQFRTLGMPGPRYVRSVGPLRLIVLDSNAVTPEQTRWLERALAARGRWEVPVFHHPTYTCGAYRSQTRGVRPWLPVFDKYGVRLVLTGHDHNYQRFEEPSGTTHVVAGGGAADLYPLRDCLDGTPPQRAAEDSEHTFLYLTADGERLRGVALSVSGRRVDSFTIR